MNDNATMHKEAIDFRQTLNKAQNIYRRVEDKAIDALQKGIGSTLPGMDSPAAKKAMKEQSDARKAALEASSARQQAKKESKEHFEQYGPGGPTSRQTKRDAADARQQAKKESKEHFEQYGATPEQVRQASKENVRRTLDKIKDDIKVTRAHSGDRALIEESKFRLGGLRGPNRKAASPESKKAVNDKINAYTEMLIDAGVDKKKATKMASNLVETKLQGRHLRKRVAIPSAAVGTGAAGYAVTSPSADMAEQLISEDKPLPELRSGSETSTKPSPTAQIKEKGTEALNKIKSILSTQGGHAGLGALLGGLGTYGVSSAMDEEDMTEEELAERRKKKAIYSILGALGGAGIGAGVHHLRNKQASAEKQELLGLIQKEASEMSTEELEDAILLNKSIYTRLSKEASDNKHVMKMQLSACVKSGLI